MKLSMLAYAALVVGLLVLGTSLASCDVRGPLDMSLLTGRPCEPPCWQGLIPGVSTKEEVEDFIATSEYVDRDSVYRERSWGADAIWWESAAWWTTNPEPNAFVLDRDTLIVVRIQLDYELTLESLLETYGPPQKLWAHWRGWGRADILVNLYYPTLGLIPQLVVEPSDGEHELQPHSKVIRVWYYPRTSLEGLVDLGESIPLPPREYVDTDLDDWSGYGPIEVD